MSLPALVALVAEFDNESLRLEVAEGRALVIRTNSKLGMLSSCRWNFGEAAALTDYHPRCIFKSSQTGKHP